MRYRKLLALGLTLLVMSSQLSACNFLRTPYERQKIAENGGIAKKKEKDGEGAAEGSGGEKEGEGQKKGEDKKKKEDKEKVDPTRAETKGERRERLKGQGILYVMPKNVKEEGSEPGKLDKSDRLLSKAEEKEPHLLYNKWLSTEVSTLEGVATGTVLLDDHHQAYVGIVTSAAGVRGDEAVQGFDKQQNVKTEGKISKALQAKVASTLRKSDPLIGTVHITSDPEHVQSLQRYAARYEKGATEDLHSQALAEHIEDIWK
jgi:hypothetical protein